MKTYFVAIFTMVFSLLSFGQEDNVTYLKQINVVQTNFKNLKSGEIINKTFLFKEGKLQSIKTSDIIQKFFYNSNGMLDMTVKEREGSDWKEVVNYTYNNNEQLIKFSKKYEEGGELVTKTVDFTYEGARIKAITKKSNTKQLVLEDIEYVVENGLISRRTSRDRNQQIIKKTEYYYYKDNLVRYKGLVGDKSSQNFTFDDKKSVIGMIAENMFGSNSKIIIPLISFIEDEIDFQAISYSNVLVFTSSNPNDIGRVSKFKYNNLGYAISQSQIEDNGIVKTESTFIYEQGKAL